jgi:hypothetical protein
MLAEGQAVDSAITEARLAIFADHNDVEWGTPVLFMRVADGRLFDVADATALPRPAPQDLIDKAVVEAPVQPEIHSEPTTDAPAAAGVATDTEGPIEPTPTEIPMPPEPVATAPVEVAPPDIPVAAPPAPMFEPEPAAPVDREPHAPDADAGAAERARLAAIEADRLELQGLVRPAPPPRIGTAEPTSQPQLRPEPKPATERRVPWALVVGGIAAVVAILIGVRLLLAPAPAPAGSARITVGEPNGSGLVTVAGSGFTTGEGVELSLDTVVVTTMTADADGKFSVDIPVSNPTGSLSAVGQDSKRKANGSYGATANGSESPAATDGGPTSAATDAGPGEAAKSPGILFHSNVHPDGTGTTGDELYIIDPATHVETQLTFNDNNDSFPTWSPDYTHIAFSRDEDIYTQEFANGALIGDAKPLVTGPGRDTFPAWSSTDVIAFNRKVSSTSSDIFTIPADGSANVHRLVHGGYNRAPAWSKDGRLAFMGGPDDQHFDLKIVPAGGSSPVETLTTSGKSSLNPNWSPDDNTLVFVQDEDGSPTLADREIYTLDVTTKVISGPLTANGVQDGNPVWSPDGTQICVNRATTADPEPGTYHLVVINADRSPEVDLMPDRMGKNFDPIWR